MEDPNDKLNHQILPQIAGKDPISSRQEWAVAQAGRQGKASKLCNLILWQKSGGT
jgi:hypothetical protein